MTNTNAYRIDCTPDYSDGAAAAARTFATGCQPNWELINRRSLDFQSGFRAGWAALINAQVTA